MSSRCQGIVRGQGNLHEAHKVCFWSYRSHTTAVSAVDEPAVPYASSSTGNGNCVCDRRLSTYIDDAGTVRLIV